MRSRLPANLMHSSPGPCHKHALNAPCHWLKKCEMQRPRVWRVPSVAVVYTDPAAAICTIPMSLSGELPKYTPRVLGENEPLHGASFPGTYTVLLPSNLLREAVPVLYASLAGHSHLCALPSRNRARRCGVSKTTGRAQLALYLLQTNTIKLLSQPHLSLVKVVF